MADDISPYQDRDILTPMDEPWDAQSHIIVLSEHGQLRFHRTHGGRYELLREPPDPATVYIGPRARTREYELIARIENVIAREIGAKGGRLKLAAALKRISEMGFGTRDAEGLLRYLVGRGDFEAEVSAKRKSVKLALSQIARARENHRTFASSFAHELGEQSEQIGRLIGHAATLGGEREELLRALLERHVPKRFHVASGFIEGSHRQIDILIYDQVDHAALFRAGNLVVVPIEAVHALIEVKSMLTAEQLADALQHLDEAAGIRTHGPPIFRGVFGYRGATVPTLIEAMRRHYRGATEFDDGGNSVFSIYEMIDSVCVLRSTMLNTRFHLAKWDDRSAPTPVIVELASEAGRDIEAALFFDRLSRYLRHPFDGPLRQASFGTRFAADVEAVSRTALYPDQDWGPYVIESGIKRVEAQITAFENWLSGNAWTEAEPDNH